jgi:molybdopterin-biosynthesis enzyme MoeA-like protein
MEIGIIVIGDEILSGRRRDKHFAHCVETLAARRLRLDWALVIGDDASGLTRQLRGVRQTGDLCVTFGGIGATPDDLTRQSMAQAYEVPVERHREAQSLIEAQFGADAYPARILMADLPRGAQLIPNPVNSVPGFYMGTVYCVPGFPHMAWPMLEWVLQQNATRLVPNRPYERTVIVHDVPESALVPWMQGFQQRHPEVKLFSLPHLRDDGGREVELGVKGAPPALARAYADLQAMIRERGYRFDEQPPLTP